MLREFSALIGYGLVLHLAMSPSDAVAQVAADPATTEAVTDDASEGLTDIIVTAEKSSKSSQRTAAAVTVITDEAIIARGVQNVLQIQALAPGVRLGQEGTTAVAFIRGVGVSIDLANIEPGVAINFNGAYVPREITGGANLFDVDQVEVLPGPQGTIYGRSASGGVINVNFKRPGKEFGGDLLAEYGNYDYVHLASAVDLPVSTDAGFRIAANYNKRDGYLATGAGADDDLGLRLSGLFEPTDQLSIFVWGSYIAHRGSFTNGVSFPFLDPDKPYNDFQPAQFQVFGPVSEGRLHQDIYLAGGQVDYRAGNITISYIPSYVKAAADHFYFLGGAPIDVDYSVEQQSNELRAAGSFDSRIDVLGGLYQFNQVYRDFTIALPFGAIYDIPVSKQYGVAAYAQLTYALTQGLRGIVGGRYSSTKRRAIVNEFIAPGVPPQPFTFEKRYNRADWKVGVEADIAPQSMAYATVQTGFNPGTYNTNPSIPGLARDLKSTRLLSYTVGIKNRFADRQVQVNLEGFYYVYRNLLVTAVNVLSGGQQTYNAARVEIYGAQVDARYAPTARTEFHASVGYLHGENKDFVIPQPSGPPVSLNGLTPIFSPRWTANVGASHTIPLKSGAEIVLRADNHTESSAFGQFDQAPGTKSDSFSKTDLSATFSLPGGRLSLTAWVQNIENSRQNALSASGGIPGPGVIVLSRPRTYGIRAGYNF